MVRQVRLSFGERDRRAVCARIEQHEGCGSPRAGRFVVWRPSVEVRNGREPSLRLRARQSVFEPPTKKRGGLAQQGCRSVVHEVAKFVGRTSQSAISARVKVKIADSALYFWYRLYRIVNVSCGPVRGRISRLVGLIAI